ncbi:hypothetical protein ABGB12_05565 [Actinocorallia sp. B10E7]|uniref:hypothetical protein n=1 Tax=Actinocorallia sp. B10E7 TaxID=3153558 RepID=UPI00325CAA42
MPFTERDLRAMLEDNSSDLPPTGDLAAAAQERGRRIRRRRQTAGAVAAAALVAVGITVVPSLRQSDGPDRMASVAASSSPTTPAARPDVDLSLLKKNEIPLILTSGIGNVEVVDSLDLWTAGRWIQTIENGLVSVTDLRLQALVGTVEGFELATEPPKDGVKEHGILMKVRPDSLINSSTGLDELGLHKEEATAFTVGATDPASYPIAELNRAVPAGTRVLLYEWRPGAGFAPSGPKQVRYVRSAVLEDADGTLVGGSYTKGLQPGIWQKVKTFDELLELSKRIEYTCALVVVEEPEKVKPTDLRRFDHEMKRCFRVRTASPAPDPTATSPAQPTPSPTSPDPAPAVPTPSPTPS